jgi:hypothetical protein
VLEVSVVFRLKWLFKEAAASDMMGSRLPNL